MRNLILGMSLCLAATGLARAQEKSIKEQLIGAWSLASVTSEMDDGSKGEPFGASPKGMIVFSSDGHFALFQSRAEIPKIAANDRAKATPTEAQEIVASSIAYYGSYVVNESAKEITVNLDASTFANVAAIPNQKRIVTLLTPTELRFDNPRTPSGMTLKTVWKKAGT